MGCGASIFRYEPEGDAFWRALQKDPGAAMRRVKEGKPMNLSPSESNSTVLGLAMRSKEIEIVKAIAETSSYENGEKLDNFCFGCDEGDDTMLNVLTAVMWIAFKDGCCEEDVTMLNILADNGASLDLRTMPLDSFGGNAAIHLATKKCKHPVVLALLQKKANANLCDEMGQTALMMAAKSDYVKEESSSQKLLEVLLENGAKSGIDIASKTGDTALHEAARAARENCVIAFLQAGASIDLQNELGETAVHVVVQLKPEIPDLPPITVPVPSSQREVSENTSVRVLTVLIENGANLDLQCSQYSAKWDLDLDYGAHSGKSALYLAIDSDNNAMAQSLVLNKADANIQNEAGNTALHRAAAGGNDAMVRFLVEKGVDVNIQNKRGETAICLATNADDIKALAEGGADLELHGDGNPLLLTAAAKGDVGAVELLAELKADLNITNTTGEFALWTAVNHKRIFVMTSLFKLGANVDLQNGGQTALHLAVHLEAIDCVKLLTDNGANLDVQDDNRRSALMIAAASGADTEMLNLLIDSRANLDLQDTEGNTALMFAARGKSLQNTANVTALVEKGAKVDLQNREHQSALKFAFLHDNEDVIEILMSEGATLPLTADEARAAFVTAAKDTKWKLMGSLVRGGVDLDSTGVDIQKLVKDATLQNHWGFVVPFIDKCNFDFVDSDGQSILMRAIRKAAPDAIDLEIDARVNEERFFEPFRIKLINRDLNKWEVVCDVGYQIMVCVANSPDSCTDSEVRSKSDKVTIQKKEPGCTYHVGSNGVAYLLFFPGFPNGGEPDADIYSLGQHYRERIPKWGSVILMSMSKATPPSLSDHGRLEAISALVEKGDNLDFQDKDGYTALMHAVGTDFASCPEAHGIISKLIDKSASMDVQSYGKQTFALELCASRRNVDLFCLLVSKGANAKLRKQYGYSVMSSIFGDAISDGDLEDAKTWKMLSEIAEKTDDLDFQDKHGCTVLMRACSFQTLRYWTARRADGQPSSVFDGPYFTASKEVTTIPYGVIFPVEYEILCQEVLWLRSPIYDDGWIPVSQTGVGASCFLSQQDGVNGYWLSQNHVDDVVDAYLVQGNSVIEIPSMIRKDISSNWNSLSFEGATAKKEYVQSEDGKHHWRILRWDDGKIWEENKDHSLDGVWLDEHSHRRYFAQGAIVQNPEKPGWVFCPKETDGKLQFGSGRDGKTLVRDVGEDEKFKKIECLVASRANLDLQDEKGRTALMFAAKHQHARVVAELSDRGANLNLKDQQGRTALISATVSETVDMISCLAQCKADLELQDNDGVSALGHALSHKGTETLAELMRYYRLYDLNMGDLLFQAESHSTVDKFRELVEGKADVNAQDKDGNTVLMNAIIHKNQEIVDILLEQDNLNLDIVNSKLLSALMMAIDCNSQEVFDNLMAKGPQLDLQDSKGSTALIYAALKGSEGLHYVKVLAACDLALDIQDATGSTALIHATSIKGCADMVSILVEKAANLDLQNAKGKSTLMLAAMLPNEDTSVALLLSKGANIDLQDAHGNSAVMHAIRNKRMKHVNALVQANANMDLEDDDGVSAKDLLDRLVRLADKQGLEARDEVDDPLWYNAEIPSYWTNHLAPTTRKFDQMVYLSNDVASKFNVMLRDTHLEKVTRDRRCPKPAPNTCDSTGGGCPCVQPGGDHFPTGYAVRRIIRIEDAILWKKYAEKRAAIKAKRAGEEFRKFDPPLMTDDFANKHADEIGSLDKDLNECWLFHGTHIRAAFSIAQSNFAVSRAGSNVGTMYGKGIYLAESCTKADEYAKNEADGYYSDVFAMILCRVCMGKLYYTTKRDPEAGEHTKDGSHDSTCGDRVKSAGTFREFVVYDADQVYPEYVVIFSRLLKGGVSDAGLLTASPYHLQVPIYWKNCQKDPKKVPFDAYFPVRSSAKKLFQELVSKCSTEKLEVVELIRYEDSQMLMDYTKERQKERRQDVDKVDTQVYQFLRDMGSKENDISIENLNLEINELLLWHGTSKAAALSISADGFLISKTAHGRRFGDGVYLAEDLDKSLSYAPVEDEGIQYVLLCRAVCGDMYNTNINWDERADEKARAAKKHSVLATPSGDQAREFITLSTGQVYPEFLVQLRRSAEYAAEHPN